MEIILNLIIAIVAGLIARYVLTQARVDDPINIALSVLIGVGVFLWSPV